MNIFSGLRNLPVPIVATMLVARGVPLLKSVCSADLDIGSETDPADVARDYANSLGCTLRTGTFGNNKNLIVIEGANDLMSGLPATVTESLSDGLCRRWFISSTELHSGAWNGLRVRGDDGIVTLDMATLPVPSDGDMTELPPELAQKIAGETTPWRAPLQAFQFLDPTDKSRADIALAYIARGFAMLPVIERGVTYGHNGSGKAIITSRVTADPTIVPFWFPSISDKSRDDLVPSVATGAVNKLIAIEGHDELIPFLKEHGMPETLGIDFGRKSFIYSVPDGVALPGTGKIASTVTQGDKSSGISVMGEGGYVYIRGYSVEYYDDRFSHDCHAINDCPVVEMPAETLKWLAEQVPPANGTGWKLTSGVSLTSADEDDAPVEMTEDEIAEQRAEEKRERIEQTGIPPFNIDWLIPDGKGYSVLAELVNNLCESCGVDPWMAFICALSTSSIIVNANAMLEITNKKTKRYPGTLWAVICALPAAGKSSVMQALGEDITRLQQAFNDAYDVQSEDYELDLADYREARKKARKEGASTDDIKRPVKPVHQAYYVDDATPEFVATTACDNPGGIVWHCDELQKTFGSFDRYSSESGRAIRGTLLSAYNGGPISIQRATKREACQTPHGYIGLVGTIQPKMLAKLFAQDDGDDGFLQRFLIVHCRCNAQPQDPETEPPVRQDLVKEIFGQMLDTIPIRQKYDYNTVDAKVHGKFGPTQPRIYRMEDEARRLFNASIFAYRKRAVAMHDIDADVYSLNQRYQDILPRIILNMHCMQDPENTIINADTVQRCILIFKALEHHIYKTWAMIQGKEVKKEIHINKNLIDTIKTFLRNVKAEYRMYLTADDGTDMRNIIYSAIGVKTTQQLTKILDPLGFKYGLFNAGHGVRRYGYRIKKAVFDAIHGSNDKSKHSG